MIYYDSMCNFLQVQNWCGQRWLSPWRHAKKLCWEAPALTALVRWIDPDARKCGVARSFSIEDVAPFCRLAANQPLGHPAAQKWL